MSELGARNKRSQSGASTLEVTDEESAQQTVTSRKGTRSKTTVADKSLATEHAELEEAQRKSKPAPIESDSQEAQSVALDLG